MTDDTIDLVNQLNRVLDERDNNYPFRDAENSRRMHQLMDGLVKRLDCYPSPPLLLDRFLTGSLEKIADRAVFLCGYMKSGTTLLLGLLDGHDELVVMPGDSYLTNKFTRKQPEGRAFKWPTWRNNWVKRMINATGQKPFWLFGADMAPYANFLQYMDYWYRTLPESVRRPVLATVFSYFCANPNRPQHPGMWVEKTPGNEFRSAEIKNLFPQAKFIHIVRDPRENLASLKRLYSSRGWEWRYREVINTLAESCKKAHQNRVTIGSSHYLIIRYEELTGDTAAVMKNISRFLGIRWDESLLGPTLNAKPAKANTMYKDREVTGKVLHSRKNNWHDVLKPAEKRAVRSILPEAKLVGYTWELSVKQRLEMVLYRLRNRL